MPSGYWPVGSRTIRRNRLHGVGHGAAHAPPRVSTGALAGRRSVPAGHQKGTMSGASCGRRGRRPRHARARALPFSKLDSHGLARIFHTFWTERRLGVGLAGSFRPKPAASRRSNRSAFRAPREPCGLARPRGNLQHPLDRLSGAGHDVFAEFDLGRAPGQAIAQFLERV